MRVGFGFSSVTFRSRVFHSRVFSHPSVDTDEQSSWKLPAFFLPNMQNVVTNSSCWQCLCTLLFCLLKSFTVPSAVLTEFAKKFYTKILASAFIFTKLSTKKLLLLRLCVSFEYQGLLQNTSASFLLLFRQCWRFIVNGITEILQHIAVVQRDVNTSRKRRRRGRRRRRRPTALGKSRFCLRRNLSQCFTNVYLKTVP